MNELPPLVTEISNLYLEGNIIPSAWFQTIRTAGTADLIAINILAEVVYWYRPAEIRDETSGQVLAYRKKFKADLWQISYQKLAEKFGLTKRQVSDAIERLEKQHGAINRVFRTITTESGLRASNVLFIEPIPAHIRALTLPTSEADERHSYDGKTSYPPRKNVIPPPEKRQTNTETPQETPRNSRSREARASQPKDPRSQHPAIQQCRAITNRYPHKAIWDLVIERLTGTTHEQGAAAYTAWIARGYNANAFGWLDWVKTGPSQHPTKGGTHPPPSPQRPDYDYVDREAGIFKL